MKRKGTGAVSARKMVELAAQTEDLATAMTDLAARVQELARLHKLSQRPFQQLFLRRQQRKTSRLHTLASVRALFEKKAPELPRCN